MIPKSARCTMDMLGKILYYKTQGVGKTSLLFIKDNI